MAANTDHSSFPQPIDKNIKLWRYMDFTKFVAMLSSESLFLSRADKFQDPYEGLYSKATTNEIEKKNNHILNTSFKFIKELALQQKKWTYINCWHLNEQESAAMWSIYSKTNESIAIETTYLKLKEELPEDVYMGQVKYTDYNKDKLGLNASFELYMHKRKSFEHENEVRIIKQPFLKDGRFSIHPMKENKERGENIKINLNKLISKIHVSPTSQDWFCDLVKEVCTKYGITAEIEKSSLYELNY